MKQPLNKPRTSITATSSILVAGFLRFLSSNTFPNQIFGLVCRIIFLVAVVNDVAIMTCLGGKLANDRADNQASD